MPKKPTTAKANKPRVVVKDLKPGKNPKGGVRKAGKGQQE